MTDVKPSPSRNDLLVFLPTYNEAGNVEEMIRRIKEMKTRADILFIDDNSPDGTGTMLDRLSRQEGGIDVIHRPSRGGIGSAHRQALRYAYQKRYKKLITMDADGTHAPEDIPGLLQLTGKADVVVGSRFLTGASDSRTKREKLASRLSHLATSFMLGLPYDLTNAFRLYHLDTIDPAAFSGVQADDYAFFIESIYALEKKGVRIVEYPVSLSARLSGKSKMRFRDMLWWGGKLMSLRWADKYN
ncbi:MAG: glycosyltransferase [Thermodesulfobacteriota bacterium]